MKKWNCLVFLSFWLTFSYGQNILFFESCGKQEITSSKKVDTYTGWDNQPPITFTRTTSLDGYADIRLTTSTTNHVWFPSGKSSDLIISGIVASNYKNLKLTFDIAPYKLADANENKLTLTCNNQVLMLPATPLSSSKFITVAPIPLPDCDSITLTFGFTAVNNTNGYRIDNFTITGDKAFLDFNVPAVDPSCPRLVGDNLIFPHPVDAAPVTIYNLTGIQMVTSRLNQGILKLNALLPKGFYLVLTPGFSWKILL